MVSYQNASMSGAYSGGHQMNYHIGSGMQPFHRFDAMLSSLAVSQLAVKDAESTLYSSTLSMTHEEVTQTVLQRVFLSCSRGRHKCKSC